MIGRLRLLHVEDSEGDAALVERALVRAGYDVQATRVDQAGEMEAALGSAEWDLVIADYSLPQFSAVAALRLLQASGVDLPFIVVSGTIGEDVAVEIMRAGARDYVMKDRLERLGPAVQRELLEAAARRERATAQRELQLLETQYRTAVETSPEGFWVVDGTGRFIEVNDEFVRRSGYSREDLFGMRITDLELGSEMRGHLDRIIRTGRERFETLLTTRSGGVWEADVSASYLPMSGGRIFVFARDVTEQKRTAREIRRFITGSPAVIYALRGEGDVRRHVWVSDNVQALTGYGVEEIDDGWWAAGLHPSDRTRITAAQPLLHTEPHQILEYRFRHKDGHFIWIRDERRLSPEAGGPTYEVIGSWVDVTSRVELEQQYRQAQKMEAVGRLAGGIAHDFNNLLTVIIGYGNLMLHEAMEPEAARANLEQICVAAERASRLTRQLLAFSRKQVLELRVTDLNAIVSGVERMLRRLIGEDVQMETTLAPALPLVNVDSGQVEQIIINIVVNARDAMPDGGRVEIATAGFVADAEYCRAHPDRRPGTFARLVIKDSGRGMTAEVKARLFEPFFTTKEAGKGTGLGLATVFGIVKQFEGHIDVSSEPGEGATFTIDLPAASAVEAEAPVQDVGPRRAGRETVLLVEDEESVRHIARLTLEAHGYDVLVASDGPQGLEMAAQHRDRVRLVVTDVVMPGMSGRELVKRLAAEGVAAKALFMSGYIDDAVVRHGLIDEGAPFLQKPFTPRALAYKVRELLDEPEVRGGDAARH